MGSRGWTALVLPLTLVSVAYAAAICKDSKVILLPDSFREQDKDAIRVNATHWPGNHDSFAGYVKVDAAKDVNLFFWFCVAKMEKRPTAPVLLWLNGGPGLSSARGAMYENGPYQLNEDGTVTEREHAWTNEFHMLYVDSPVGVGYSYSSKGTIQDKMEDVVESLYQLITFMNSRVFPEYFRNGLYIGGQSYAGKYIPHLGQYIHNKCGHEGGIPLRGMYLGNALCDPESMFPVYTDSLYHAGLISNKTRERYQARLNSRLRMEIDNDGHKDSNITEDVILGEAYKTEQDLRNLLAPQQALALSVEKLEAFMNQSSTARTLNAGAMVQEGEYKAYSEKEGSALLRADFIHGTRVQNRLLMDNYKVLHYSGNLDMMVTVAMTDAFLNEVDWSGRAQYREVVYTPWMVGENILAGWFAKVGNFTRVIVRNAGHDAPADQPQSCLEMMKRFVYGQFDQPVSGESNCA